MQSEDPLIYVVEPNELLRGEVIKVLNEGVSVGLDVRGFVGPDDAYSALQVEVPDLAMVRWSSQGGIDGLQLIEEVKTFCRDTEIVAIADRWERDRINKDNCRYLFTVYYHPGPCRGVYDIATMANAALRVEV